MVVLAWFSPWWAIGRFLAPLDLQNRMMSPWNATNSGEYAKNHFVSDAVDQYLVYRLIAERDFKREGGTGWSSLTYGGTAQYANTMALYGDWTMQLHRCFDFKTAWHLGLLGQALIAAFGMRCFLRARGSNELWALCGALLWAANSQFVTWIYHRWTLGSFCWVPWALWAADKARKGDSRAWIAVPLFLSLSFMGGTLQHTALVALVMLAYWFEGALAIRPKTDGTPLLRQSKHLGLHMAWGVIALGIAGFVLVPGIAAFLESSRLGLHTGMHGHAPGWYPEGRAQPLVNFLSYPLHAFPSLLGSCGSLDVLKLFKSELFHVAFFGTLPALLALSIAFRRNGPSLAKWLMLMGLLVPLTPAVRILYQRVLLLFILGGIIAFVHFMNHGSAREKARLAKWIGIPAGAAAILWTLVSVIISLPAVTDSLKLKIHAAAPGGGSFGYYQHWLDQRVDRFVDGLVVWSGIQAAPILFLAAGLVGLAWMASASAARRKAGALTVAIAAVLDVTCFASRWVTWSDQPLFAETPESRILREKVGRDGRTTTLIHPTAHMALTPFVPNTLAAYGIASIHGYDSIVPDGMLLPFEDADNAHRLGRLGVTHLLTWHGNPNVPDAWTPVWTGPSMDLYQNPHAAPRYAGFRDKTAFREYIGEPTDSPVSLTEDLGRENSRRLTVPPSVSLVRVAENAAAGWKFRIAGGDWREVEDAGDGSMILDIGDADKSRIVEMNYDPPLRKTGWQVTGGALFLLLAGCGLAQAVSGRKTIHRTSNANPYLSQRIPR